MSPIHLFQFFLFSLCVNIFSVFIYIVYYTDILCSVRELELEYDYIIVGSGTAGSLIAHRLATETNYTFIVLEAGGRSNPLYEIPIFGPLLHGSVYDWQYETEPQENACLGMEGNKWKYIQGKILGGSSKLNNMIHVRGNLSHYVDWFHGKYTEDYIQEHFNDIENRIIQIEKLKYSSELSSYILEAAAELGYNEISEVFNLGFGKPIVSQRHGKRWTTSDKVEHLRVNTLVEKLLIHNNKCHGIALADKRKVFARKAVILSAGTFNSPKLLQLSGIGPKELLKSLSIPIVKELPVGKNLQDHIGTGLDLVLFDRTLSINAFTFLNPWHIFQYFINGRGPYTSPGCEAIGFLSTKNGTQPDIQFMVLPVGISTDRGCHLKKSFTLKSESWQNYFARIFDKHAVTVLVTILHPKSKGEVNIRSRDPNITPSINPNYLSNKDDINTLIEGVKFVKKLVTTKAMTSVGAFLNEIPFPGCEDQEFFSNSYLECYIRHLTLSSFHPIGTCSMGLASDKNAVVDSSFKVIDIDNLYVADASVLPTLPSGNINAAIALMASIFFEANIKHKDKNTPYKQMVSYRKSFLAEFVYKVCPAINQVDTIS